MGKLIEFYIPASFPLLPASSLSPSERGKVIEFHTLQNKKTAYAAERSSPEVADLVTTSGAA
jgi:hypothetical protein